MAEQVTGEIWEHARLTWSGDSAAAPGSLVVWGLGGTTRDDLADEGTFDAALCRLEADGFALAQVVHAQEEGEAREHDHLWFKRRVVPG